ncbi:MAG: MerR family transcriptional regulator [Immundisolibacteraceae bacterium]|nr:MerR family transcriptional regulator [Immundisolibacteraceae bacterium]
MNSQQSQEKFKVEDCYNARDIERITGISQATVRKYIQHYKGFIEVRKGNKNRNLFTPKSMAILVKIKSLTQEGCSRKQIKGVLGADTSTTQQTQQEKTLEPSSRQVDHRSQESVVFDNHYHTEQIKELNLTIHTLVTELQKTREEYKSVKHGFYFIQSQLDHMNKPWWVKVKEWISNGRKK